MTRSVISFDVIIPTYNRAATLDRAVKSVLLQTYPHFTLWVVDDGSTDETAELMLEYADHPKCRYLKSSNRGVSAARNLGIQSSCADWIALLDSDDEWLPHKLAAQTDFIEQHAHIPIVHGEELWIRHGKRVNPMKKHQKSGGMIYEKCLALCLISPSAVAVRRDLLLQVGLFDEQYPVCEDYDLWLKITAHHEVGFISDPLIMKYGGHEDQLSRRYVAMDYWRVRSLAKMLEDVHLKQPLKVATAREMVIKGQILLKGYEKHQQTEFIPQVSGWLALAQAQLT